MNYCNRKITIYSRDLKIGEFNGYVEYISGCKNVRIINKPLDGSKYEIVNKGIKVLQKIPLHTCSVFETRLGEKDHLDYDILVRSFSDVIVFDEDQRYLFLNL